MTNNAEQFRTDQPGYGFLPLPSVDEWQEWHLARFVAEVVDQLDLSAMERTYRGSGSASYQPAMLLGLLIYGYATRVFSSRAIERATHDSVAFRVITKNGVTKNGVRWDFCAAGYSSDPKSPI